jgi:PAS domain S-box-containing protein
MDLSTLPWQEILSALGLLLVLLLNIGNRKLKKILSETKVNGGTTIKDQLDRIEGCVATLASWMEADQHLSNKPIFKADLTGKFIWINSAFSKLVGAGIEDLKGMGWLNFIYNEDHDKIAKDWEEAIRDKRKSNFKFRIVNSYTGELVPVKARAFPVFNHQETILGYLGSWVVIEEDIDLE